MTERELLAAWDAGDTSAANALIDRHIAVVHGFLRDKVEPGMLDDLVQRTFLTALERRQTLRDGAKFGPWLVGIARNLLLMHWREVATTRRLHRRFEDLTVDDLLVTPSQVVARREEQRMLLRALRRIPIELQLLLELFYWEGFGHAELVEMLEMPSGTIKSRLNRARELLVDALRAVGASDDITGSTSLELDAWVRSLGRGDSA
jgi:RNA polymerase sigma factor (sigma-70 family)